MAEHFDVIMECTDSTSVDVVGQTTTVHYHLIFYSAGVRGTQFLDYLYLLHCLRHVPITATSRLHHLYRQFLITLNYKFVLASLFLFIRATIASIYQCILL